MEGPNGNIGQRKKYIVSSQHDHWKLPRRRTLPDEIKFFRVMMVSECYRVEDITKLMQASLMELILQMKSNNADGGGISYQRLHTAQAKPKWLGEM
jgi:hypothetical protein